MIWVAIVVACVSLPDTGCRTHEIRYTNGRDAFLYGQAAAIKWANERKLSIKSFVVKEGEGS